MKKLIWVAAGIVVLGGVAVALTLVKPSELVAAPPNEEMAPDTLVAFAQVDGLAPIWKEVAATEAWKDLLASEVAKGFGDSPTGKALADLSREAETKADYALDTKHAMQFLGRQVSVGLDRAPASGEPGWLALTKLDVDALVAEMLEGKRDWRGLHAELEKRAGKVGFEVTRSEHKGHAVSTAKRAGVEVHATLLGDTLAVSSSRDLLQRTIDVTEGGGAGSLAKSPRYRDEVARLPKGRLGWQWADLQTLRETKAPFVGWLKQTEKEGNLAAAADRLLEGTAAAPALAVATELPAGDLYQVKWSYSRTATELAGPGAPKDHLGALGDWTLTMAVHDVGSLVRAWDQSALRKKLAAGPIGEQIDKLIDDPSEFDRLAKDSPLAEFAGSPAFDEEDGEESGDEEDEEEEDKPAASAMKSPSKKKPGASHRPDKFTLRFGLHILREILSHGLSGDAAVGCELKGAGGEPVVALLVGLGTEGYLGSLALEGLAVADGALRRADRNGVPMFVDAKTAGAGSGALEHVCIAHLGEAVVFSNDDEALGRVLDAAAKGRAAPAGAAPLDPGWFLRGRFEARGLADAMRDSLGSADAETFVKTLPATLEFATYAAPDLSWVETRTISTYDRDIIAADASGEPRTWKWLPERTILVGGAAIDLRHVLAEVRRLLPDPRDVENALAEAKQSLEVDIEGELLPALGPEIAIAVVHQSAPAGGAKRPGPGGPAGGPPPIPGLVLSVEVKDEAAVKRALDAAVRSLERMLQDPDTNRGGESPGRIVRESSDGLQVVRFEPSQPGEMPFQPTLALGRGRLLIGLDLSVIDACLDAGAGKAPAFAASPVRQRMRARADDAGGAWMLLDWNRAIDQVAEYSPQLVDMFPASEAPDGRKRPEFPTDGGAEDYERFEKEMKAFTEATRGSQMANVKKWIDALRLIDHIAIVGTNRGRIEDRRMIVKFAE